MTRSLLMNFRTERNSYFTTVLSFRYNFQLLKDLRNSFRSIRGPIAIPILARRRSPHNREREIPHPEPIIRDGQTAQSNRLSATFGSVI